MVRTLGIDVDDDARRRDLLHLLLLVVRPALKQQGVSERSRQHARATDFASALAPSDMPTTPSATVIARRTNVTGRGAIVCRREEGKRARGQEAERERKRGNAGQGRHGLKLKSARAQGPLKRGGARGARHGPN